VSARAERGVCVSARAERGVCVSARAERGVCEGRLTDELCGTVGMCMREQIAAESAEYQAEAEKHRAGD